MNLIILDSRGVNPIVMDIFMGVNGIFHLPTGVTTTSFSTGPQLLTALGTNLLSDTILKKLVINNNSELSTAVINAWLRRLNERGITLGI